MFNVVIVPLLPVVFSPPSWSSDCAPTAVGTGTRVYTRQAVVNKLRSLNAWWNGK